MVEDYFMDTDLYREYGANQSSKLILAILKIRILFFIWCFPVSTWQFAAVL